jgi:hypothetical protein
VRWLLADLHGVEKLEMISFIAKVELENIETRAYSNGKLISSEFSDKRIITACALKIASVAVLFLYEVIEFRRNTALRLAPESRIATCNCVVVYAVQVHM